MKKPLSLDEKLALAMPEVEKQMQAQYHRPLQSYERNALIHQMKLDGKQNKDKTPTEIAQEILSRLYNALGPAIQEPVGEKKANVDLTNPEFLTLPFGKLPVEVQEQLIREGDTLFQPGSPQRREMYRIRISRKLDMTHPKDIKGKNLERDRE